MKSQERTYTFEIYFFKNFVYAIQYSILHQATLYSEAYLLYKCNIAKNLKNFALNDQINIL